ncbi:unnamed protein product (macronuclear) [Paramecium tetraurelia]|uniref:Uncharacterized protein n=1 Tax=Paramecium tetraurelia TaxID=5888 RepID=A0C5D3_PARTE|nr:uncharacterized protein GSPATT00006499001 [Paramecium tetraurelia]CAK66000.1 unnamed protein product [Paramecium tetraurelia]|eukprot:XP_001433397.1 hypothetical protein (macronuclear) [Paramecium tetraurelia strain d4-2]
MYQTQTSSQKQIEEMIAYSQSNLSIMLNMEQFMKYFRASDPFAIDFLSRNVKQMFDILFVDYDKVQTDQLVIYSDLISKIFEIIDLNLEPIMKQIEIYWEVIFDLRWRAVTPDTQWGVAHKLFQLIKDRDKRFVLDQFQRPNFLVSFLPLIHINSVAQILIIFYEFGFHQQQLDFLRVGFDRFQDFDPCSAINFTFIVHEIMIRILNEAQIEYVIKGEIQRKMFSIIVREDINAITLKNAAHVLSLVSNYYSMDMQNIQLDEPETQEITQNFRRTEFFECFDVKIIAIILQQSLLNKTKVGLLIIKLIEVIDNLVRITDIQLWEKVDKANIMELIFNLVHKFNKQDIFISYVGNMISFVFERALNDFHPYWASKLILKNKIHDKHHRLIDKQIYEFESKLSLKLIKDGEFLPYYDYLKQIEEELMISHNWRTLKLHQMKQEEKHRYKLGEDPSSPQFEEKIIVSALDVEDSKYLEQDGVDESANNIFINCQSKSTPKQHYQEITQNIFETTPIISADAESESNSESSNNESEQPIERKFVQETGKPIDPLDQLKEVLQGLGLKSNQQNKLSHSDQLDREKVIKNRNLSNSLNHEEQKNKLMTASLRDDYEAPSLRIERRSSLQLVSNVKKLNKNFEEFHIDFFNNRKILKKDDNSILKVDEIDFEKLPQKQIIQVVFQKQHEEVVLKTKLVEEPKEENNLFPKFEKVEDIKFRQLQQKDLHFLEFLKNQE